MYAYYSLFLYNKKRDLYFSQNFVKNINIKFNNYINLRRNNIYFNIFM